MAGVAPQLKIDDNNMQARLHQGPGGTYLWIVNQTRTDRTVKVEFAPGTGSFKSAEDIWGGQHIDFRDQQVAVTVPARDAIVVALQ
jgi:beta-galactosidase